MIIIEVVIICVIIGVVAVIINGIEDYHNKKSSINISFAETMGSLSLPLISLTNNGRNFYFLIDTGATLSIIDSDILNEFEYKELEIKGNAYGIDGNIIDVSYVKMELSLEGVKFMEAFQVMRLNAFDNIEQTDKIKIAGILGSTFLNRYDFILDFKELVVHLNNNKNK